jgi:hypothetical protein
METDNHPHLEFVTYDSECNVEKNLIKGRGTVHMVKSAMKFIHVMYPETVGKVFELSDKSYVECQQHNKIEVRIPLCYLYLVKHGKTWYEDKFAAYKGRQYDVYKTQYNTMKRYWKKFRPSFSKFAELYDVPKYMYSSMEKVYNKCENVYAFVKNLISDSDCHVLNTWFVNLVEEHMTKLVNSTWFIPYQPDMYPDITVQLQKDSTVVTKVFKGGSDTFVKEGRLF